MDASAACGAMNRPRRCRGPAQATDRETPGTVPRGHDRCWLHARRLSTRLHCPQAGNSALIDDQEGLSTGWAIVYNGLRRHPPLGASPTGRTNDHDASLAGQARARTPQAATNSVTGDSASSDGPLGGRSPAARKNGLTDQDEASPLQSEPRPWSTSSPRVLSDGGALRAPLPSPSTCRGPSSRSSVGSLGRWSAIPPSTTPTALTEPAPVLEEPVRA